MDAKLWREFNLPLLGCVLALISISVLIVHSATLNAVTADGSPLSVLFPRHLLNIFIGALVGMAMLSFDYRLLSGLARPLFLITIAVLGVLHILGIITEGAQSWLSVGTRTFQPSEIAKLTMIIVLATYFARFKERCGDWSVQLGSMFLVTIPMVMVLIQPDLGTAVVFGGIWLTMAWMAGIRWQQLLILLLLALPLVFIGWQWVLDAEQKSRWLTFYWLMVDPSQVDPNDGYNIIQSLNAIGSGGMFGTGLTNGLLSQGNYIPVQYSDFIFAVIGEEMGFAGSAVLIVFQFLLLWIALSIARKASDDFGRLIAIGIFGMFFWHLTINLGVAIGLLPVTGLPMPFISYGGSFTITTLAAVGLLENVAIHWRRLTF
jgi:rod shape determining protein RodA